MTKTIKNDLILKKDTTFNESIIVEGNIKGNFNLRVIGNIDAWDIDALDIDALDINALNINAWDINARYINARDINAFNIDALNIICEKRIKKSIDVKTIARVFIQDKSKLERKEQMK